MPFSIVCKFYLHPIYVHLWHLRRKCDQIKKNASFLLGEVIIYDVSENTFTDTSQPRVVKLSARNLVIITIISNKITMII